MTIKRLADSTGHSPKATSDYEICFTILLKKRMKSVDYFSQHSMHITECLQHVLFKNFSSV